MYVYNTIAPSNNYIPSDILSLSNQAYLNDFKKILSDKHGSGIVNKILRKAPLP